MTDDQPIEYLTGVLVGMAIAIGSLVFGVTVGTWELLHPITRAAAAWAVGAGTMLWVMPWVKKAVGGPNG